MKRGYLIFFGVILLASFIYLSGKTHAASIVGSTDTIPFLPNLRSICKDGDGNLHVVWIYDSDDRIIKYANNTGGSWSSITMISIGSDEFKEPAIACDGDNITISTKEYGTDCNIFINTSTDNGATWDGQIYTPAVHDEDAQEGSFGNPVETRGGKIYLGFGCYAQSLYGLCFARSDDYGSSWNNNVKVIYDTGAQGHYGYPSMVVDKDDSTKVYMVSYRDYTDDVYFNKSTDSGDSWSGQEIMTGTYKTPISMAVNGSNIYVVARDNNYDIYFVNSTDSGASWTTPYRIDTLGASANRAFNPSVTLNPDGHPIVFWEQNDTNTNYDIVYRNYTGSSWESVTALTDNNQGNVYANTPYKYYDDGKIHYVWRNGTSSYNIIYDYIAVGDITPPTYSNNQTSTSIAGYPCNFTLDWNDTVALHTSGEYIFSTNNTGEWVNATPVSFQSTPETAWNVTTLNDTAETVVAWCFYAKDNAGNWNSTSCNNPFILTTLPTYCDYSIQEWELPYTINQNNKYYCLASDSYIAGQDAITFSSGVQNSTIDCLNHNLDGNDGSGTSGVYLTGSNTKNNTIKNCNITDFAEGIYLNNLGTANCTMDNFTASSNVFGIRICFSSNSNITNSHLFGNTVYGIAIGGGCFGTTNSDNIWTVNTSVHDNTNYDYYLNSESSSQAVHYFKNTNFTTSRKIAFDDNLAWFSYNNRTDIELWLKTRVSAEATITRELINWNQSLMQWNDTETVTAYYNVSGLLASTDYDLYNNSVKFDTKTTDAEGVLPQFSVDLSGEHEIKVSQVVNTAPTASTPTIYPSSPKTADDLKCEVTITDPDSGDTLTTYYKWYVDDVANETSSYSPVTNDTATNVTTLGSGNTTEAEVWICEITPYDGTENGTAVNSSSKTIQNTDPVVTLAQITPLSPTTSDALDCGFKAYDVDADTLKTNITWYKDDVAHTSDDENEIATTNDTLTNTSSTGDIESSDTTSGEEWICSVTTYDESGSHTLNSSAVTIQNTAPVLSAKNLTPVSPTTVDDLLVNATCYDVDAGDTITAYYQMYVDDAANETSSSTVTNNTNTQIGTLTSGNTTSGEQWIAEVWCGDGTVNTTKENTTVRTIGNTPPVMSLVQITPSSPTTTDTLDCGFRGYDVDPDTLKINITWFKNGASHTSDDENEIAYTNNTLQNTSATGDIEPEDTSSGEEWICQATIYDEAGSDSLNSSLITIQNTAPSITKRELYPTLPATTDDLELNMTCHDVDSGDTITSYWDCFKDDVKQDTYSDSTTISNDTETTVQIISSSATSSGEEWVCECWCGDGTSNTTHENTTTRTIQNTAPVATSVDINPTAAYTNNNLEGNATVYDVDSDTLTAYYIWYKDNVENTTGYNSTSLSNNTDTIINISDSSYTAKGETWIFGVIPHDGTTNGTQVNSSSVTIQNTVPTISQSVISPSSPTTSDDLEGNGTCYDMDADTITAYWTWYVNDAQNLTGYQTVSNNTNTLLSTLDSSNTTGGQNWTFGIVCGDGTDNSTELNSTQVTIQNTQPTSGDLKETPDDPADYSSGQNYYFNITVNDPDGVSDIDTVLFSWNNGANVTVTTSTQINSTAKEYQHTLTDLPAQTSTTYTWYANDTSDAWTSQSDDYTINRISPSINLTTNCTWAGTDYEPVCNQTGWVITGDATATKKLYRDGEEKDSGSPASEIIRLGVGNYDYNYTYEQSENYTFKNITNTLVINTKTINLYLALNDTQNNKTYTYPEVINATAWKDSTINNEGTVTLLRDGVSKGTPGQVVTEEVILGVGVYNYSATFAATNYTATSITSNRFANVTQGEISLYLAINGTEEDQTFTYPVTVNVTAWRSQTLNDEGTQDLLRNGTILPSLTEIWQPPAKVFNYTTNFTSENYTVSPVQRILTINKALQETTLQLNGTSTDKLYFLNQVAELKAWSNISSMVTTIYTNYTGTLQPIASGNNIVINLTNTSNLGAGKYLVLANSTGNENYTDSTSVSYIMTVKEIVLTITCEAGGPYSESSEVLVIGNLTDSDTGEPVSTSTLVEIIKAGSLQTSKIVQSTSGGKYSADFTGLGLGSYVANVTAYGTTCTDTFEIKTSVPCEKERTIQLSGVARDFITGELVTSGNVSLVIEETGDEKIVSISNGLWSTSFKTCLAPGERYTLGIMIIDPAGKSSHARTQFIAP
jgi:hypothetical protein